MPLSYSSFIKKYNLNDITTPLSLVGTQKVDFVNDFNSLFKSLCTVFDKFATIASEKKARCCQTLMAIAKLCLNGSKINKAGIMKALKLDKYRELDLEPLKEHELIIIDKVNSNLHLLGLNLEKNPDLKIFSEIIQEYWQTINDNSEDAQKWMETK